MFQAVLGLQISHRSGPEVDSDHVLQWLVADSIVPAGLHGGFQFFVCTEHKDPDECPDDFHDPKRTAAYVATFSYAGYPPEPDDASRPENMPGIGTLDIPGSAEPGGGAGRGAQGR